ncbi:MAG: hypothetical protein ACJ75J_04765 [Cytophagaceae bacterium]
MRYFFILFFFLLLSLGVPSFSQILPEYGYYDAKGALVKPELFSSPGSYPLDAPHWFNNRYIAANRIKKISIKEYSSYDNKLSLNKEEEKLSKVKSKYSYGFDSTGRIQTFQDIYTEYGQDTVIVINYEYNPQSLPDVQLLINYTTHGLNPKDKLPVSLRYMKDKSKRPFQRLEYIEGNLTSLIVDYEWDSKGRLKSDKKIKKNVLMEWDVFLYNEETALTTSSLLAQKGEAYLKVFIYENDKLSKTMTALASDSTFSRTQNYTYNAEGRLVKISSADNEKEKEEFIYDDKGRLTEYVLTGAYSIRKYIFNYYSTSKALEEQLLMEGATVKKKWKYSYELYK